MIVAFSLASTSKSGARNDIIILNETQATTLMSKALGIEFDDSNTMVLNKIADLERKDMARIEKMRNQHTRIRRFTWESDDFSSLVLLLNSAPALRQGEVDKLVWKLGASGLYSVKSAYEWLSFNDSPRSVVPRLL